MIKKIFFITILNGIMFSLQAIEPAEKPYQDIINIVKEHFALLHEQRKDEGYLSFLHALQNRKLSLQSREEFCDCGNMMKERMYYIFSHFNNPRITYEFSLDVIAQDFSANKNKQEQLFSLFPINLIENDESLKPYSEAYATFLANTDLSTLPWHESEEIMQNRAELIDALASEDVDTIKAALKLKIQPEKRTVTELINYLKTISEIACPLM